MSTVFCLSITTESFVVLINIKNNSFVIAPSCIQLKLGPLQRFIGKLDLRASLCDMIKLRLISTSLPLFDHVREIVILAQYTYRISHLRGCMVQ